MRFLLYALFSLPSFAFVLIESGLLDYNLAFAYYNNLVNFDYREGYSYISTFFYFYPFPTIAALEYNYRRKISNEGPDVFE